MIIISITTALDNSIEQEWIHFMKQHHIPSAMATGCIESFRFSRIMPEQGVDVAYNVQFRCTSIENFNDFQTKHINELKKIESSKFQGKYASFQTLLEEIPTNH